MNDMSHVPASMLARPLCRVSECLVDAFGDLKDVLRVKVSEVFVRSGAWGAGYPGSWNRSPPSIINICTFFPKYMMLGSNSNVYFLTRRHFVKAYLNKRKFFNAWPYSAQWEKEDKNNYCTDCFPDPNLKHTFPSNY